MNHPTFDDQHTDAVVGYLAFLRRALGRHYDGPSAVVTVRENHEVTEVTVNDVPVFRVRSDRAGTVATQVVQDRESEFGRAARP